MSRAKVLFKMKLFLGLVFCLVVWITDAHLPNENQELWLSSVKKNCSEETGFPLGMGEKENFRKVIESKDPEYMKKAGCFRACVMKKFIIMENNIISREAAHGFIEKLRGKDAQKIMQMKQSFDTCQPKIKNITDECDLSNVMFNCFYTEMQRFEKTKLPVKS